MSYTGQHEPWSPAYPAFFHSQHGEIPEKHKDIGPVMRLSLDTHNIVIRAIVKAKG